MDSSRWSRWTTIAAVFLLAGIAAVVSYSHMYELAQRHGEPAWRAALFPLSVDGMIVASSMAPLAAYVVRLLPARVGTLVGGLIVVTNARTFLLAFGLDAVVGPVLYTVLAGLWLSAVAVAVRAARSRN